MSSTTEVQYAVLYYKRKAKVHKSKGVSKIDGTLSITPPPESKVVLKNEEKVVYRAVQSDIAKRAQNLEEEEVLVLGGYEVEVFEKLNNGNNNNNNDKSTASTDVKVPSNGKNTGKSLLFSRQTKLLTTTRRPLHPKANPLLPKKANTATIGSKRFHPNGRPIVHVPQPVKASNDLEDESSSESEDKTLAKENSFCRTTSVAKRPLLSSKAPGLQKFRKLGNVLHRRLPPKVSSTPNPAASSTLLFPDTVETLDLPHSIKSVLKPHQISGVSFLWNCLTGHGKATEASPHVTEDHRYKGAILADEMGLGKTLMTIAVICGLHRQRRDRRFVVVCPSSLVANWAKEFDKWLGKASQPKRVVIKKGGQEGLQKIRAWSTKSQSEILIISYDLLRLNSDVFREVQKVHLLVVDEGHRLKNTAGSQTLTALESLPCQARLCITATPIQNILSDFFTITNFVCPGLLGDLPSFRRDYERPISASNNKNCSTLQRRKGLAASRTLDEITKTFMLRRMQKDVLKTILPPRHECLLFCSPTVAQCRLYKHLTKDDNFDKATADALKILINLRKLCSHPSLLMNDDTSFVSSDDTDGIEGSGKVKVLDALLQEIRAKAPKDKVVIVSNFTSALTMIENTILKPRGLSFIRLDGTTELSNRQSLVDTFNATTSDRHFIFLLSSKAGGCGLNLIGANRLVMFDPDWNPASDIQAMARVYRQGQTKPCWIYRMFTTGTVEEVICQRQIQKGNLATRAVDGAAPKSGGTTSFTKEELQNCFSLKENCACDTKIKVGDKWPQYYGPRSIESLGCDDRPLLVVAADETLPLSFVHLVREINSKTKDSMTSSALESESEEEIFTSSDEELASEVDSKAKSAIWPSTTKSLGDLLSSSDEEFEFE